MVVAALGGIEPSPLRCNPDRPIKKLYNSDEYMSGSDIEVSSEEEIEVTSEEESDDEHPARGVGGQSANAGMMPPSDSESDEEEVPRGKKVWAADATRIRIRMPM